MSRVSDDLLGSMLAVGAYDDNHSTITDALLDLRDARRERDDAEARCAMLREALVWTRKYATGHHHVFDCPARSSSTAQCRCGYSANAPILSQDAILSATDASAWLAEHDARVRAEMKERCAAIADRFKAKHAGYMGANLNLAHEQGQIECTHDIAAAIRALGDAPAGEAGSV